LFLVKKGSNDSIAEYCILAEVPKKFEKILEKKFAKKVQKYYKLSEGGEGGVGWGGVGRVENCHSNA
jgi:hypothetical protein